MWHYMIKMVYGRLRRTQKIISFLEINLSAFTIFFSKISSVKTQLALQCLYLLICLFKTTLYVPSLTLSQYCKYGRNKNEVYISRQTRHWSSLQLLSAKALINLKLLLVLWGSLIILQRCNPPLKGAIILWDSVAPDITLAHHIVLLMIAACGYSEE